MKRVIYNAVPAWEKAPAAMDILRENLQVLIRDMEKRKIKDCTVILPKGEMQTAEKIKTAAGEAGIHVQCILADRKSGLVYQNDSALLKAAMGEKANPFGKERLEQVVPIENLIETENGRETGNFAADENHRERDCTGHVYIELPGGMVKKEAKSGNAAEILNRICPSVDTEIKAVYSAYPQAGILTPSELEQFIPQNGAYLRIIGSAQCMLEEMNQIAAQYRKETCGKCVFGHEGSAQIQMIFGDMALKKGKASDIELLRELCRMMQTQTLCEIGCSLADIVLDMIEKFGGEILEHISKKSCPAGVCSKFLTFHILPDKCTGCNECADYCEEEAILGRKRFIHVIDQDECIQCGLCMDACDEGAIVKAGSIKPRCPKKPIPCKPTHH